MNNYNEIYSFDVNQQINASQDFNNFSYTGPSLIGMRWSGVNTAKLTQGHEFLMKATQVLDTETVATSTKDRAGSSTSKHSPTKSNFRDQFNKRLFSAKLASRQSTKPKSILTKTSTRAMLSRSVEGGRSKPQQKLSNLTSGRRAQHVELPGKLSINPKTRNPADHIVHRCISVETHKSPKAAGIPQNPLLLRISRDHIASPQKVSLSNTMPFGGYFRGKRESAQRHKLWIKAYDASLQKVISWK